MTVGKYYDMNDTYPTASYSPAGPVVDRKPKISVERKFTFSEDNIKAILARYVEVEFDIDTEIPLTSVRGDYAKATYSNQFDSSPGYCDFTVTVLD